MSTTHVAHDMDAYDMHGNRVRPEDYQKQLRGAVAFIRFFMKHYTIKNHNNLQDVFTADVASIRVIFPPIQIGTVTPKRMRCQKDPFSPNVESASETKRRKKE